MQPASLRRPPDLLLAPFAMNSERAVGPLKPVRWSLPISDSLVFTQAPRFSSMACLTALKGCLTPRSRSKQSRQEDTSNFHLLRAPRSLLTRRACKYATKPRRLSHESHTAARSCTLRSLPDSSLELHQTILSWMASRSVGRSSKTSVRQEGSSRASVSRMKRTKCTYSTSCPMVGSCNPREKRRRSSAGFSQLASPPWRQQIVPMTCRATRSMGGAPWVWRRSAPSFTMWDSTTRGGLRPSPMADANLRNAFESRQLRLNLPTSSDSYAEMETSNATIAIRI